MIKEKIIIFDWTYFIHQSIYSYNASMTRKQQSPIPDEILVLPSTYIAMTSLIGCLKKVGLNDEVGDKVIIACDGRHSWRKEIEIQYKANRQEQRQQAQFVDWEKEYFNHNQLIEKIENNLPFFTIKIETIEADDIIAETCRFFSDKEVIIVSPDHDFDQLLNLDNVKIFSPHPHKNIKSCPYRILDLDRNKEKEKAYKSLMKKIRKETADNLVSEILTEEDYDKREKCISLLKLPEEVVEKIKSYLEKISITSKEFFEVALFSTGIQKRMNNIWDNNNLITYDYCKKLFEKRLLRKKNRKEE